MAEPVLETILLVEDTPSDATLIRRGFEKTDVLNPIVWVKNGQEALGYLSGLGNTAIGSSTHCPRWFCWILICLR